ncbi:hypothetical protein BABA_24876 [Neobacillus bataviensis LMG 21833]|uniref:Uncharacterized protein n=1 Tax=Neobacillus bataviensis LMG 21833 TaxID=1117379 RepID=K6D3T6_9BACI|nr:hypothetical protein BABA_24876 [Neobacillus bataviensis LMG 21833]
MFLRQRVHFNSVSVDRSRLLAIKEFLKNPVIYAFLLGLILHTSQFPQFIGGFSVISANQKNNNSAKVMTKGKPM